MPARSPRRQHAASATVLVVVVTVAPVLFAVSKAIDPITVVVPIGTVITDDTTGYPRTQRRQQGAQSSKTAEVTHAVFHWLCR